MNNSCNASAQADASIIRGSGQFRDGASAHGRYLVSHIRDGKLLSYEEVENVVTNEGKNFMLDSMFVTTYTVVAGAMGLFKTGTPTTASTMATPIITECVVGEIAARASITTGLWSAAASGSKSITAAVSFTAAGSVTVTGCFLVYGTGTVTTVGSTAGKMWSAGTFSGSKVLVLNDVLQVTYATNL